MSQSMPSASDNVSKSTIVAWINGVFHTNHSCIKDVPAKAAAKLLNAMIGREVCPLANIQFDDSSSEAARRANMSEVLITLAPSAGYTGSLTPDEWINNTKFSELLKFWRWLYCLQALHPLPPNFESSLNPIGRKTVVLTRAPMTTMPMTEQVPQPAQLVDDAADVASRASFPENDEVASVFSLAGKENSRCCKCTGLTKMIAKDVKKLKALQKAHQDLMTAIADRDVARVAIILESI